jgi:hypothetical protein
MPTGAWERETMRQCQAGIHYPNGSGTGSFCRKRDLCRSEGRCHFVAQVERLFERTQRHTIRWLPGYDEREVA